MPPEKKVDHKKSKIHNYRTRKTTKSVKDNDIKSEKNVCSVSKSFKMKKSLRLRIQHRKRQQNDKRDIDASEKNEISSPSCEICLNKFKSMRGLRKHLAIEHSENPGSVQCKYCPVRCPNIDLLLRHIVKNHERQSHTCPNCNKSFVRAYHVLRHLKHSKCSGPIPKSFLCEICDCKFSRKDNLLSHLRTHIKGKEYVCKICLYETNNYSRFTSHTRSKHSEKTRFECDHCGKVTTSRGAMAKHLEIHGEKKFACEVCNYTSFTIEVMRRHVLRHTSDKPHKCPQCPQSFIQTHQLRKHIQKHEGIKCDQCGEKFKRLSSLIVHQREHSGLKELLCPYKDCPSANKPFTYEATLQEHLRKHENRGWECEVCSKAFSTEINLRRHTSTHSLERPRRCMYCVSARAYIRGDMLVRHVRIRHPSIFQDHLSHVRQVLGYPMSDDRVKQSEVQSILNLLDAISDRILAENSGENVLYGGMTSEERVVTNVKKESPNKETQSVPTLMSESELSESLKKLMTQLVDLHTLEEFGWPKESIDMILEKVLEQCGQKPADRERWSRVQCLRENAKHLFLHVIEDKAIARMLSTHTIDQVVMHILKVNEADDS